MSKGVFFLEPKTAVPTTAWKVDFGLAYPFGRIDGRICGRFGATARQVTN